MKHIPDKLLQELAEKWLNGTLLPEEEEIFNKWYESYNDNEKVAVEIESREAFRNMMLENIRKQQKDDKRTGKKKDTVTRKLLLISSSVAAVMFMVFAVIRYIQLRHKEPETKSLLVDDVKPGGNKAILTLADGRTVILDGLQNGTLAGAEKDVNVVKADSGLLVYHAVNNIQVNTISYNTLTTPKGGKYQLILPDGTKVWLNAESSIRYPTAFIGDERKVFVTGEAYFQVVHNSRMPFRVKAGNFMLEDIGTEFDINTYANEPEQKITISEGSVRLSADNSSVGKTLIPGQQAIVQNDGKMSVSDHVNVASVIAWKSGLFDFSGQDIRGVMRQLQRWYNISVQYSPDLPSYNFGGQTYMNTNLSEVLKVLELNGIHFKIEKGGAENEMKLIIKA